MLEPSRRGKIARLPRAIREELNHRLDEGDPQKDLVVWLNSLPDVKEVLQTHFEGKAITVQNLSDWKQGGHRDWRAQLEAQEIAHCLQEEATTSHHEDLPPLVDTLALWLATRLAAETRRIAEAEGEERWKLLRQFGRELATLRRSDFQKQRLQLARDRLALARERQAKRPGAVPSSPEPVDPNAPPPMTRAEKIASIRQAFFADVDAIDSDVLNLPPLPKDPYYQPGIVSSGGVWRVRGKAVPSPNDEKVRQAKIQEAKDLQREIERLNSNLDSTRKDIDDLAQLAAGSSSEK